MPVCLTAGVPYFRSACVCVLCALSPNLLMLPGQDMDEQGEGAGHQVYVEEGEDEGGGPLHVLPVHLLAHLLQGGPHL